MANQYYRDNYLKSQDWKNLSGAVKAHFAPDSRCWVCDEIQTLDAHHLDYRKLDDVLPRDLFCVCRKCHNDIHKLLKQFPFIKPQIKNLTDAREWFRALLNPREKVECRIQRRMAKIRFEITEGHSLQGSVMSLAYARLRLEVRDYIYEHNQWPLILERTNYHRRVVWRWVQFVNFAFDKLKKEFLNRSVRKV